MFATLRLLRHWVDRRFSRLLRRKPRTPPQPVDAVDLLRALGGDE